jgi:hypothetical protein
VFEHALSWTLNKITKKLNVYSGEEKLDTFIDMYARPIELNTDALIKSVEEYKDYLDRSNNYFSVGSYFEYGQDLENIESYILNLPVFAAQKEKISWKKTFGIEFNDWNRYHYLSSDVGSLALDHKEQFNLLLSAPISQSRELQTINRNLFNLLPNDHKTFLKDNLKTFVDAKQCVNRMIELGIMHTSIPIKKQTLREKMHIVKNLDECIDAYNSFIEQNPGIGDPVNKEELMEAANVERTRWLPRISQSATTAQSAQQNSGLLLSQNDGRHGHNPID